MFELPSNPAEPSHIRPSIYLDYGVDAAAAEDTACEVCERGMRFCARWHFEVGTLLSVAFTFEEMGVPQRVEAEGVVVECGREPDVASRCSCYRTTLAFLETPPALRSRLGNVSARLSAPLAVRPVSS